MVLNFKKSVLALAILSQPAMAVEHVDQGMFDQQVIHFDQMTDSVAPFSYSSAEPEVTKPISVVHQQLTGAVLEANLSQLTLGKVVMDDGLVYNRIILPDGGSPAEPGEPNLTGYRQMVRIPDGATAKLVIDDVSWSETFSDITVDPVQLPFPDVVTETGERPDENMPFIKNQASYELLADTVAPVRIAETIRVRGKNYVVLSYRPIEFNPLDKSVMFATKVRFRLSFEYANHGDKSQRRSQTEAVSSSGNSAVIDLRPSGVALANNDKKQANANEPANELHDADYLIITADRFQEAIEPLAAWKRKMGYKVYVAPISETGSTQAEIKAFMSDAYHNGTMTSYVLFVGDHEDVPGWSVTGHGFHGADHQWHTDFDYALLDGEDKFPDVIMGRLPGDTPEHIQSMVARTLAYAKNPVDSDRYRHALLAGQFQDRNQNNKADRMFMEDLHRVADFLGPDYNFFAGEGDLFNKGYQIHTALQWDADLTNELRYGGWDYGTARITPPTIVPQEWKNQGNGDRVQIAQAINDGVGFVMHRDHGYGDGSGWADPHFTQTEVNQLNNGNLSPVVLSLNCATGWFDGKDSFAESWMRNPNGGAVGFTGAARVSYSGYNDNLHAGLMDSFWDDYDGTWSSAIYPVSWRPAAALNRAKERLFSHYGTQGTALAEARFFSWFGDPELELRTERPQQLVVTHPELLSTQSDNAFTVVVQKSGNVLENARVAIVGDSIEPQVVYTNSNGEAQFNLATNNDVSITVTEHNAIPYEGAIVVEQQGPTAIVFPALTVEEGGWFFLDGRQSESKSGELSYLWEQVAGKSLVINRANSARAWVNAPKTIASDDTLLFKLTVTDESGAQHSAIQTVMLKGSSQAQNTMPVATVAPPQKVMANRWITLDGQRSFDSDGEVVQYQWKQIEGPTVRIDYADSSYAYAMAPEFDTTLKFELTVTDNAGGSAAAVHTVKVESTAPDSNKAPVANIAKLNKVQKGQWMLLDGRQSHDPDGSVVSYQWTQVDGPEVRIDYADKSYAYAYMPHTDDTLSFKLTVTDNKGKANSSILSVVAE